MKTKSELILELSRKVEALEGCIKYQDIDKTDSEINAMADRLAQEIRELEKELRDMENGS